MFSRPRATSPRASDEHLAVLGGEQRRRSRSRLASTSSRKRNMTSARRDSDGGRHAGEGRLGRGDGGVDLVDRGQVDLGLLLRRWRGRTRGRCGPTCRGRAWPPIQWWICCVMRSPVSSDAGTGTGRA